MRGNMNLDVNLNVSQQQKQIISQKMQQSVRILQMSACDLREYIDKALEENPVLESEFQITEISNEMKDRIDYKEIIKYLEFDNYGSRAIVDNSIEDEISPFNFISKSKSFREFLYDQLFETSLNGGIQRVVEYMIEALDDKGYLNESLESIAESFGVNFKVATEALEVLQGFEPLGVGARDLKECIKIQISKHKLYNSKLEEIISKHLESVADNRYNELAKIFKITIEEAQVYCDIIKSTEPKPSRGFFTGEEVKFIIPDAVIREIDGENIIIMNDGIIPKLSINNTYKNIINGEENKEAKVYVKEKIDGAMFLIKSIEQRRSTLYKILTKIIERQEEFFNKGKVCLKPMGLKEVAEEVEVHESTVSRAIKDKFVLTKYGTIKIKDFFGYGISTKSAEEIAVDKVKAQIKLLVDNEDKTKPLSDQKICDELNKKNLNISRRTVAKYREEMGVKSSSKRKRV